jgi:hypothetical protein
MVLVLLVGRATLFVRAQCACEGLQAKECQETVRAKRAPAMPHQSVDEPQASLVDHVGQ